MHKQHSAALPYAGCVAFLLTMPVFARRPFAIDKTAVTVGQFSRFLKATGHVTDAEKYKWSFVLE